MIYLDNCATTKMRKEVLDIMYKSMIEDFGNPSSLHRLGMKAEKRLEEARDIIADYLGVRPGEIYFTSGGTESNNLAIQSLVESKKKRGRHIITSSIEHPSVLNIMKKYEEDGFRVSYLKVDSYGNINMEEFSQALGEDTILVSLVHVNNEIGVIQDLKKVRSIINEKSSQAYLHIDGIQSFGKIKFSLREIGADSFSFSGHKVHGPKGVGGVYIKEGLNLKPIVYGGNQEKGIRSGTENLNSIIGLGEAVRIQGERQEEEAAHIRSIKSYFIDRIGEIDDIRINSDPENSSPYIVNLSINNTRGEVLLHYLEDKEIYISTSSACSSKGTEKSHVLKGIGLNNKEIEGSVRICFSYENTRADIDYLMEILKVSIEEIRKIMMR